MKRNTLSLAIAVIAAGFAQNSLAATATAVTGANLPSYPTAGSNVVVVNIAGSSAQDKGIINILLSDICSSSSALTIYKDSYATTTGSSPNPQGTANTSNWGGRWASYVCTTGAKNQAGGTLPAGIENKTIVINKRSAGGSAYGILPLINNPANNLAPTAVNFMNVQGAIQAVSSAPATAAPVYFFTDTVSGITVKTYGIYATEALPVSGGGLTANSTTTQVIPDAGVSDTNPGLFTSVENQVPEFGQDVAQSDVDSLGNKAVTSAAALTFTVPVSLDLYKALQAAQGITVPAGVNPGEYGSAIGLDDLMPSLSSTQLAAIFSGNVKTWDSLSFKNGILTSATNLATAGVTKPSDTMVHYLRRTPGSGSGAQQYARFLNFPTSANAAAPASDNRANGGPAVPYLLETADEESAFDDLANGTTVVTALTKGGDIDSNVTGVNNGKTGWGIGVLSADKNVISSTGTYSHKYRHIKVDGYAPTLQNVYDGNYKDWAQSSWVTNTTWPAGTSTAGQSLIAYFTQQATQAAILNKANVKQYFGPQAANNAGYLGLVANNNGGTVPTSLTAATPVIPYAYPAGDNGAAAVPAAAVTTLTFGR